MDEFNENNGIGGQPTESNEPVSNEQENPVEASEEAPASEEPKQEAAAEDFVKNEETGYTFGADGSYSYSNPNPGVNRENPQPQSNDNMGYGQPDAGNRSYPYGENRGNNGNPNYNNYRNYGNYGNNNNYGNNGYYGNNANGGFNSYRSQTPPPYGYQRSGNVNPYSNQGGRPGPDSQNPYPYANRMNKAPDYSAPEKDGDNGERKPESKTAKIVAIVLGAILVLLICCIIGYFVKHSGSAPDVSSSTTSSASEDTHSSTQNNNVGEVETAASPEASDSSSAATGEMTPQQIYSKIEKSSVGVIVYESSVSSGYYSYSGGNSDSSVGEGSGVLIKEDNDGKYTYIVTCAHVISDADSVVIQLYDNTEYDAEIVGYDTRTDLGVLRIKASGLTLAEIGDSTSIKVGDSVYAIGNPGGTIFAGSFTNGMVSALDRPISSSSGYSMECIQHTAAINPGNSGGALVNAYGQLIGINSSKIVSEDYEGMGFSIPSSVFTEIVNNIITNGYVANRAKLGIKYRVASYYSAYQVLIGRKELPSGALVIEEIAQDSGLANTKVQTGDIIIGVNGEELSDATILASLVENASVGDEIKLTIARVNKNYEVSTFEVTVTLVEDTGN